MTKPIIVYLTEVQKERLAVYAKRKGQSLSEVVRRALARIIEDERPERAGKM